MFSAGVYDGEWASAPGITKLDWTTWKCLMQEFIFGELEAEVGGYFVCAVWRNKYNFQLELTCWESWNFKELPQIKTWPKNVPIHKLAKVSAILTWTPGWQLVRAEASRHQLCTVKLHFLSTLVFNFQLSTSVVATIDQGTKPLPAERRQFEEYYIRSKLERIFSWP